MCSEKQVYQYLEMYDLNQDDKNWGIIFFCLNQTIYLNDVNSKNELDYDSLLFVVDVCNSTRNNISCASEREYENFEKTGEEIIITLFIPTAFYSNDPYTPRKRLIDWLNYNIDFHSSINFATTMSQQLTFFNGDLAKTDYIQMKNEYQSTHKMRNKPLFQHSYRITFDSYHHYIDRISLMTFLTYLSTILTILYAIFRYLGLLFHEVLSEYHILGNM